jgi:hypothetical protein
VSEEEQMSNKKSVGRTAASSLEPSVQSPERPTYPPERPTCAYPLHEAFKKGDGGGIVRCCAGSMILPDQAGIEDPKPHTLLCLCCGLVVDVDADVYRRAADASQAEGWTPIVRGPLVPGALPAHVREALWLHREQPGTKELQETWAKASPALSALGLLEGAGLTALGREMQRLVCEPAVPKGLAESTSRGPAAYAKLERARTKKPRPTKPQPPAPPMICAACGHSARAHITASDSCRECGCSRYRQARTPKKGAPAA